MYFWKFPRGGIKAVYLGHRMEPKVRGKIVELLYKQQAQKFDVIPSRYDYTLRFEQF